MEGVGDTLVLGQEQGEGDHTLEEGEVEEVEVVDTWGPEGEGEVHT